MGRKGGAENWVDLQYQPVGDQSQRDDAAFALIVKGVEAWEQAESSRKYPFDLEDYSPNFEGRDVTPSFPPAGIRAEPFCCA